MADRFFTRAEVEGLIPALTELMDDAMTAHAEVAKLRERAHEEQQRIAMMGGAVIDQGAWRERKEQLDRLARRVQERLEEIVRLGGVPKDLGLGLVDFPHRRGDEVVNLCWKYGERTIAFWHGLDEGFASRKPL